MGVAPGTQALQVRLLIDQVRPLPHAELVIHLGSGDKVPQVQAKRIGAQGLVRQNTGTHTAPALGGTGVWAMGEAAHGIVGTISRGSGRECAVYWGPCGHRAVSMVLVLC
jgi:hypothetical protein